MVIHGLFISHSDSSSSLRSHCISQQPHKNRTLSRKDFTVYGDNLMTSPTNCTSDLCFDKQKVLGDKVIPS